MYDLYVRKLKSIKWELRTNERLDGFSISLLYVIYKIGQYYANLYECVVSLRAVRFIFV